MSYFREQLEEWLKRIDVKTEVVLDVGGLANPVEKRVRNWDVEEYRILDNGAEVVGTPDYFYDINNLIDLPRKFDIVFCLEVFEYLYNPVQAIENISSFVKPGGIAYISFPTIYPVHNPAKIDFLRYTKRGVEKLLEIGQFKTWEITPRIATAGIDLLAKFYSVEGMHPVKDKVVYDIGYMVKAWKGKDV